ncbi:uncharacterized protein LOC110019410 [Phalaenopsis equestris]|uniref:uncharacterized protein LOC110019410 n=1 Tax=Phalaenopsis equestris TaxID=78828 RepID=UPI0009E60F8B|nr:uncharacterized protein LOC110019410 [Phalaenopsis equestris]
MVSTTHSYATALADGLSTPLSETDFHIGLKLHPVNLEILYSLAIAYVLEPFVVIVWAGESSSSPNLETKKRRRKDSEGQNEMNLEHVPKEHVNRGNIKIKAAARNAPLVARNLNQGKVVNSFGEHYQEGKLLKIKPIASPVIYKKQSNQFGINLDVPPSTGMLNKDASSAKLEPKDVGKTSQEKAVASQVEPQPKKLFNCENEMDQLPKIRHEDRCKTSEYLPMTSYPTPTDPLSHRVDNVTIRPKGTTLERAIQELEKIVALSRPPNPAVREVDSLVQGVKRRLPQEVKQKLAKVARLSASQGKISEEELIDRLMGFLGHLVQRKTLKRNMREMVELGLSAKQQKADKLQQIKKEVHQMIKLRVSILKSKGPDQLEGSADDFQNAISTDERKALTGRYSIDVALEEKLCDLYDLYVEGMDEDKGPQSRKLYVEFAELWPPGYMDNLGIRDAIYRAKKRRQHKLQVRNKERIERKKLTATAKLEKPSPSTQPQADQERHLVPRPLQDKPIPNLSTASQNKLNDPSPYRSEGSGSKHHENARGNSSDIISDGGSKMVSADMKKNMKRKSEIEGDCHAHPQKMLARPGKIKHNLHGPNNDSNPGLQPKPVVQMPASVASVQPC